MLTSAKPVNNCLPRSVFVKLQNYVMGKWYEGGGLGRELLNASTGEAVAAASTEGIDLASAFEYARNVGGPNLRKLTFHQRGRKLKALALHLTSLKEKFYQVSYLTGATKRDSWIDIEGGIGNLFAMSSKARREMPNDVIYLDGKPEILGREGSFIGQHAYFSKCGVAVHINAFNFPIWGMLEKIAVNLVAGVPAIVKPATLTSYLTEAIFKEIVDSQILPEGSLQLLCGPVRGILDHVESQDVVTFTGSASTARHLREHPRLNEHAVPFNVEADSLNACLLGADSTPNTEEFEIFIKEVCREMTVKAGQKCTAIRRIIVPQNLVEDVSAALKKRLSKVVLGDPQNPQVRMGPLAGREQLEEVGQRVRELEAHCQTLYCNPDFSLEGGDREKGAFMAPTLLLCENPLRKREVHHIEAFGPVSTIMPYSNTEEAITLSQMGGGSLVSSIVTGDNAWAKRVVLETAAHHGRILVLNRHCAGESTGHGSPLPTLVHGGPGRAGGGEEMGGIRGVFHYMQRTALQGHPTTLTKISSVYLPGAERPESERHPFRYHFEELHVGQTLTTHKRTITESDIVNFSNVSWDHFYAHTDTTSLEGTLFDQRVAHGYFILAAAAGLFVDPGKGPVMANYGLDELRFIKPVYAGATLQVKLTVKEKIDQENKEGEAPRGVVKWQVDVLSETPDEAEGLQESVAIGTILTLVGKKS